MDGDRRKPMLWIATASAGLIAFSVVLLAALLPRSAAAEPGDTQRIAQGDTPTLSPTGRFVGFRWNGSQTDHYGPAPGIWLLDRTTGLQVPLSDDTTDWEPHDDDATGNNVAISADGRYAAFMSQTYGFFDGENSIYTYEVLVHDSQSGETEHITKFETRHPWVPGGATSSFHVAMSGDGRYVVFDTYVASVVADDTNGFVDVFVYDRTNHTFRRVSTATDGVQGNGDSSEPAITPDGRYVAFWSKASNLVPGDTNGIADVFLRDLQTGTVERVSLNSSGQQGQGWPNYVQWSYAPPALSADARFVAFASSAAGLAAGDTNNDLDIFVRDRQSGVTQRTNVAPDGAQANWICRPEVSISGNGRYVAYSSSSSNLVPGDTNGIFDVFVRDRWQAHTERASVTSDGLQFDRTTGGAFNPALSADGRFVAFDSDYSVYLHEVGGTTVFAYRADPGAVDFGAQTIFTRSSARTYTLQNVGTMPLTILKVELRDTDLKQFVLGNHCADALAPGAQCTVDVSFAPDALGLKQAKLAIVIQLVSGTNGVMTRDLSGTGVLGSFTLQPTALWFGSYAVGTTSALKSIVVRNTGASVLPIRGIALGGTDAADFSQRSDCPEVLKSGGSCSIGVRFEPTVAGARHATVTVWGGGGARSKSAGVNGTGY